MHLSSTETKESSLQVTIGTSSFFSTFCEASSNDKYFKWSFLGKNSVLIVLELQGLFFILFSYICMVLYIFLLANTLSVRGRTKYVGVLTDTEELRDTWFCSLSASSSPGSHSTLLLLLWDLPGALN